MPGSQDPFALIGTILEGQFRIDAVIGEGGFGVVYKGWHLSFEQPVAIKALKMHANPETRALVLKKFREEAKLLYTLSRSSLNIVRSIDFGAATTPNGSWVPFVVLEWLEGQSLADNLAQRRARGFRGRPIPEAFALLEPVAKALAVAHEHRVAHRDIKPGNVFLTTGRDATVKLLDFGIAKAIEDGVTPSASSPRTTGFSSFTPQYAAPEQLEPRFGPTGPWTDVYGFALLVTEVLTDRVAVDASDVMTVIKEVLEPRIRPTPRARGAHVPDAIEAACLCALAVDPKARFPDVASFWAAMTGVGAAVALPAYPQTPPQPPQYAMQPQPPQPHYAPSTPPHYPSNAPVVASSSTANILAAAIGGILTVAFIGLTVLYFKTPPAPPPASSFDGTWVYETEGPASSAQPELAGATLTIKEGTAILAIPSATPVGRQQYRLTTLSPRTAKATETTGASPARAEIALGQDQKLTFRETESDGAARRTLLFHHTP